MVGNLTREAAESETQLGRVTERLKAAEKRMTEIDADSHGGRADPRTGGRTARRLSYPAGGVGGRARDCSRAAGPVASAGGSSRRDSPRGERAAGAVRPDSRGSRRGGSPVVGRAGSARCRHRQRDGPAGRVAGIAVPAAAPHCRSWKAPAPPRRPSSPEPRPLSVRPNARWPPPARSWSRPRTRAMASRYV